MDNRHVYHSKEVWWFSTDKPDKLEQWFNCYAVNLERSSERTDFYLSVSPQDNISYKLREGKTEIKLRVSPVETITFPNGHTGKADKWIKWSLELKDLVNDPGLLYNTPENNFIPIKKKRALVVFEIPPDETVKQVINAEFPDEGCEVELTCIDHDSKRWYSFALEAFGNEALLDRNFHLVTTKVLTEISDIHLEETNSYSYPVFLEMNFREW